LLISQLRSRRRVMPALWTGVVTLLLLCQSTMPSPARAADASAFDPGNIISDAVFFNGNAMSASEVQAFLNGAVSRCTLGDPGKPPGGIYTFPSGLTTVLANECLKDYKAPVPGLVSDTICDAIPAGTMTVAEMIRAVGLACNVSQKVLIVLLEKEQSLISDTFPAQSQYDHATGFNCPDTAPCSSASAGLFRQIYSAARQLQVYGTGAYNWYPVGSLTNVAYQAPNVNPNCGSSPIFIQNRATAALYYYTPYQPNAAALENLYGTGDSCSAYGNRNFWRMYTDWFGSTLSGIFTPYYRTSIQTTYLDAGGANGFLGAEQSGFIQINSNGGGWVKAYTGGAIAFTTSTGAYILQPPLRNDYAKMGGVSGTMGWPTGNMVSDPANGGGAAQYFQNGRLLHATGASEGFAVQGQMLALQNQLGGASGSMGWPISAATCTPASCSQDFQYARGFTVPNGGSVAVPTAFAPGYDPLTDMTKLGTPVSSVSTFASNGGGSVLGFQFGAMTKQTSGTFQRISGRIRAHYATLGGISGPLGWPTGSETCTTNSCTQKFQFASIVCLPGTVGCFDTRQLDAAAAASAASLGAATTGYLAFSSNGGGLVQAFARGAVASSPSRGAFAITGGLRTYFNAMGGLAGPYGWPNGAALCSISGSCSQEFQGGTLSYSPTAGGYVIAAELAQVYKDSGSAQGTVGAATSGRIDFLGARSGIIQVFETGVLTRKSGAQSGYAMSQSMRTFFNSQGGITGGLGWPTANATCGPSGTCIQNFERGTLTLEANGTGRRS
jgi:uncharacterized protein with LGFP repeats